MLLPHKHKNNPNLLGLPTSSFFPYICLDSSSRSAHTSLIVIRFVFLVELILNPSTLNSLKTLQGLSVYFYSIGGFLFSLYAGWLGALQRLHGALGALLYSQGASF